MMGVRWMKGSVFVPVECRFHWIHLSQEVFHSGSPVEIWHTVTWSTAIRIGLSYLTKLALSISFRRVCIPTYLTYLIFRVSSSFQFLQLSLILDSQYQLFANTLDPISDDGRLKWMPLCHSRCIPLLLLLHTIKASSSPLLLL